MTLVRIVKNWDLPDLLRQTPGSQGIWDDIHFTVDPIPECDYLILLNNMMLNDLDVRCAKENVWVYMQEPYIKGKTDWMVRGHKPFGKVYTHHLPSNKPLYEVSHPAVAWHVNRTFDQLTSISAPAKIKPISWITSNKSFWPGHKKRMAFLEAIQKDGSLEIDIFGRGIRYLEDKWDGLAPYAYSLAIENSSGPDYWTEKLADCFLAWTVPIYYGCTNLEDYFPPESFIRIDIEQPKPSIDRVKAIVAEDDWNARYEALVEARNLYLTRHQFFPHVARQILSNRQLDLEVVKENIKIPTYKDPWTYRAKRRLMAIGSYVISRKR